ncbi:MAG TPA: tRNA (adenosine(37)-N6)-threonylcarbamoyltransferase complex transferase subunit TsaD [Bacteroidota bacterium]|nr:tRNA (adenosine(37)-N6)-threonylcarbamoyltransferase complex transferase subunit TsaD [Bacteroidota bacterium]
MNVLGIETSCDETSAAVLTDGRIRSNVISSQFVHRKYGGVVPELASRAHQELIVPVVREALGAAHITSSEINGIAVTYGPGLMGALMIGLNFAKALSYGLRVPFIGINHMEAHMVANFIDDPQPRYPFLCLIVSGGHTQLVLVTAPFEKQLLGETLDDAAGEAFDKVAKILGLGFPGGPVVDKLASSGNPHFVEFPRSLLEKDNLDFSFSGIKTSVLYWMREFRKKSKTDDQPVDQRMLSDLCASFQAAVVDVLIEKTCRAARALDVHEIAIAGGVSANSELRRRMGERAKSDGFRLHIPRFEYCTDNAAMIAMTGWMKFDRGDFSNFDLSPVANLPL